jgi:hypothetical protein
MYKSHKKHQNKYFIVSAIKLQSAIVASDDELLFSSSSYTMLESVKGYIYERRNGLTTAVTFVGGCYLARHYIQDRLDEVKVKLEQERAAQDRYECIHVFKKFIIQYHLV